MTSLPTSVRDSVEAGLAGANGRIERIVGASAVSGGCIHNGHRIATAAGTDYFVKWNAAVPVSMFAAEADGLGALATAARVEGAYPLLRVPTPLAWGGAPGPRGDVAWLVMEYLEPSAPLPDSAARLGRGLAQVHARAPSDAPGWPRPNWIGSLGQDNRPAGGWGEFWRERRIAPQLTLARGRGLLVESDFDRLLDRIPDALDGARADALLHGDLWSGNTFTTGSGDPVLIDPAVYVGDGEVDLAMTELFGGFGAGFYRAYDEVRPISSAYPSHRRDLYQLYYLLVHVNLFGGSYVPSARSTVQRILATLG